MKKLILFFYIISTGTLAISQDKKPTISKDLEIEITSTKVDGVAKLLEFRKPDSTEPKFKTKVVNVHAPKEYSTEVTLIKEEKNKIKEIAEIGIGNDVGNTRRAFNPKIGVNFEGNELRNVSPPDNAIAVSTDGYVVSVDNYTIEYYKTDGTVLLSRETHSDFFNNSSLNSKIYDPRVIYDPKEDKFIYVVLHGSTPATSKVLVSFSKTSNPQDGWNIYTIDINGTNGVMKDNTWFDYPSIGISTNELFISGNMFSSSNSFDQSILLQIEKENGFKGTNFNFKTWKDVKHANGGSAFTMKPLSFGQNSSYGPGIYLVSNSSGGSPSQGNIYVYDLTDDIASGNSELKAYKFNLSGGYELAGDASQKGTTDKIQTGNCRIQRGFFLDGILHFVFNAEYESGFSGINYCRIDIANSTLISKKFGLTGFDYAYPSIASFSSDTKDKTVLIHFLRTGSSIYPQTRVVTFDHAMNSSNSILIKAGSTFVSQISGAERWGDYTGIARKYGATEPEVWVSGCYGVSDRTSNGYNAWIAQVTHQFGVGVDEVVTPTQKVYVTPNPVVDLFTLDIDMKKASFARIHLMDVTGKVVKVLYEDKLKQGINELSFNKNALASGTYFVNVMGEDINTTTKLVVE